MFGNKHLPSTSIIKIIKRISIIYTSILYIKVGRQEVNIGIFHIPPDFTVIYN